ncbi:MAG TPA: malectin domain-containing carbohydrate-binding protein, partial [Planctomycetota bacterium]|nr:malectin domain-containing carbohydrate-binding protein [Planctomycetota bacterium]
KSLNGAVERVGINFGAPGDRRAPNGTLWLDWPAIGGPSPAIDLRTEPEKLSTYYRHSVRTRGGAGWPWVLGSGARGVERIELAGLRRAKYRVRLFFAEPDAIEAGARVFDIRVNAEEVASAIDLAAESRVNAVPHTTRPGIVREHVTSGETERLTIELVARRGETIISGIEVIAADLDPGELPRFPATTER